MKQLLTLACAAVALSAAAATPQTDASTGTPALTPAETALRPANGAERLVTAPSQMLAPQLAQQPLDAMRSLTEASEGPGTRADTDAPTLLYTLPEGTFFEFSRSILKSGGWSYPQQGKCLVPNNTDLTYSNVYHQLNQLLQGDFEWYSNSTLAAVSNELVSSDRDYTANYTITQSFNYSHYWMPDLRLMNGNQIQDQWFFGVNYEGNHVPYTIISGGNVDMVQSNIDKILENNKDVVEEVLNDGVTLCTTYMDKPDIWFFAENAFAYPDMGSYDTYGGLTDGRMTGFGQRIPNPGKSMVIKSITIRGAVECKAGATMTLNLYDTDAAQPWPIVGTATCTFTTAQDGLMPTDMKFNFVTVRDGMIDPVPYIISHANMLMMVTGFDGGDFTRVTPQLIGYPIGHASEGQLIQDVYAHPMRQYCQVQLEGKLAGKQVKATTPLPYVGIDENNIAYSANCLFSMIDLEFPYLQTWQQQLINPNGTSYDDIYYWTELPEEDSYECVLNSEGDGFNVSQLYVVRCPEVYDPASSLIITDGDGNEVPDEVDITIQPARESKEGDLGQRYFYLSISLASNVSSIKKPFDLVLDYHGCRQTYHVVSRSTGGVHGVEAPAADIVASRYFDIQGRELASKPASGLFIRHDLRADGSTTVSKLAR